MPSSRITGSVFPTFQEETPIIGPQKSAVRRRAAAAAQKRKFGVLGGLLPTGGVGVLNLKGRGAAAGFGTATEIGVFEKLVFGSPGSSSQEEIILVDPEVPEGLPAAAGFPAM